MSTHELKTDPAVFQAVWDGRKPFEIRFNDRNFKEGDTLLLRETKYSGRQMREEIPSPLIYTGRSLIKTVTYVLLGPIYGLSEGWVIMGIGFEIAAALATIAARDKRIAELEKERDEAKSSRQIMAEGRKVCLGIILQATGYLPEGVSNGLRKLVEDRDTALAQLRESAAEIAELKKQLSISEKQTATLFISQYKLAAEIARLRDALQLAKNTLYDYMPRTGSMVDKALAQIEAGLSHKGGDAPCPSKPQSISPGSNAAPEQFKPSVERPQRKHLVVSAGYWYRAAQERGINAAAMCMEQAYNHTENALYSVTADRDRLQAENEKLKQELDHMRASRDAEVEAHKLTVTDTKAENEHLQKLIAAKDGALRVYLENTFDCGCTEGSFIYGCQHLRRGLAVSLTPEISKLFVRRKVLEELSQQVEEYRKKVGMIFYPPLYNALTRAETELTKGDK